MSTSYPPTTLCTQLGSTLTCTSLPLGWRPKMCNLIICSPTVPYNITVILYKYIYTYMYFCYKFDRLDFNGKDAV